MSLTHDDVKALCAPFDEKTLGVKVQSTSRDKTKAMLVCYLQHTDVAARLDSIDPKWDAVITDERQAGGEGGSIVRMRITLKGVSREGIGDGQDAKSAASDALKRTAMLFGVGRYLYDSEQVWVPYNEQTDRFKPFSYADYKAALRPGQMNPMAGTNPVAGAAKPPASGAPVSPIKTNAQSAVSPLASLNRAQLGKAINDLAAEIGLGTEARSEWVMDLFQKSQYQLTQLELIKFHGVLEGEKAAKQERFK